MKAKYNIPDRHLKMIFCLLLILSIIIIYAQVRNFDFVGYDDKEYVTENSLVQKGLTVEGVIWSFTSFNSANWHPVTWLSHMLDCELYGLNPKGHHWTNLIFHMTNTILLFLVLELMTGAIWRSAFVAALFALHPLHVESVAWISERKDVLSTFFGLLMICAYYRYIKTLDLKNYLLVFISLCLGLMAKPMLVTFPFVLLLLDFWPLKRFRFKNDFFSQSETATLYGLKRIDQLILEKIPLFIPVVISSILTFFAQKNYSAVKPLEALSLKTRFSNALVSYINYILKTVWPSKLAVFYPYPRQTLPTWQVFGAALILVCLSYLAIRVAKKYPYIVVGLFWYLGTLVPVIGLIQVGEQAMADRYTYIPLIGIFIIFSWGALDLFQRLNYRKIYIGMLALIILSAFAVKTFFQLGHWKNGITLFEHAVKVTENNYMAHNNLATALGSTDIDRAIFHYKEALRIHPKYLMAICNLGLTYYKKGNYEEAASYFTKALKIDPRKIDTRIDLANIFFLQGKFGKAISQYSEILKTDSENVNAHYNLAHMLFTQKKIDQAVLHYNEALRIDPKCLKAHYNLGNILLSQGKIKEATIHFFEAIKIKPDYVQAYNKLGIILLQQGKFNKAKVFFSKAIELDPNFLEARKNLEKLNQILSKSEQSNHLDHRTTQTF